MCRSSPVTVRSAGQRARPTADCLSATAAALSCASSRARIRTCTRMCKHYEESRAAVWRPGGFNSSLSQKACSIDVTGLSGRPAALLGRISRWLLDEGTASAAGLASCNFDGSAPETVLMLPLLSSCALCCAKPRRCLDKRRERTMSKPMCRPGHGLGTDSAEGGADEDGHSHGPRCFMRRTGSATTIQSRARCSCAVVVTDGALRGQGLQGKPGILGSQSLERTPCPVSLV